MKFGRNRKRLRSSRACPQRVRRLLVEPLEIRQLLVADLAVNKSGPATAKAGSEIVYTITLNNIGDEAADTVRLEDVILDPPAGNMTFVDFVETSFFGFAITKPNPGGTGTATAEIGSFPPGVSATFNLTLRVNSTTPAFTAMQNTATATANNDSAPANNVSSVITTVATEADLSVTKSDSPPTQVAAGGNITYTIVVTNDGPSAAADVELSDLMPANTTLVSFTPPTGWSRTDSVPVGGNGTLTARNPSFNVGSATFSLIVTVAAGAAPGTDITNNAAVASRAPTPTVDPNPSNDTASAVTTVQGAGVQADLSITKTDGVTTVSPGGALTYTIVVSNISTTTAVTGATVTDTFPASLTNVTFTSTASGGATGNTPSGSGNISNTVNLPAGASITYTVNGTVSPSATGSISNTATVAVPGGVTDPVTGNNSATDTDTIVPATSQADLSITKTDGVTTVSPGGALTYTIVVSNISTTTAVTGATVTDTFPASLTNVTFTSTASGGATGNTPSGSGNISNTVNLPAGASITYTVNGTVSPSATGSISNTATVAVPGGVTDPVTGNNSATDTDTIVPATSQADLSITKTDGVTTVSPGGALTYTIVVSNISTTTAVTGATVTDTFPASLTNVTFTSTASGGATGNTPSGSGNISNTVNLPAGASITYTVNGTVSPSATGSISNTATVAVPGGVTDPVTGNNSATDTDTIVPATSQADLSITKTDGVTTVSPGGALTYTIVVSNISTTTAVTGATVTDTFPASLTNVTFTSTASGGATGNTPSGSGNISNTVNLPAGASITYTVNGTVSPTATGTIINTANVAVPGGVTDPVPGNNAATDNNTTIIAAGQPDLSVSKNSSSGSVIAGSNLSFTITVNNVGAAAAANARLTDILPANTTFVSLAAPAGWTATAPPVGSSGTVSATNPSLGAGGTANFTLVVQVSPNAAGGSTINNTATVSTTGADASAGNNSSSASSSVVSQADLSITKIESPDPVSAGGNLTFTITVANAGPSSAQGVSLSDVIPANTTFVSFAVPAGWTPATPAPGGTGTVTASAASLAANSQATFTLVVNVNPATADGATITNTATASTTSTDAAQGNNSSTTTSTAQSASDYGDASASYGTLLANDGARHVISSSLRLGFSADFESDGQANAQATGDDFAGTDDEDGVLVPGGLIANQPAAAIVTASGFGLLDAWVDFNRDGIFDSSERIAGSLPVVPGDNNISFAVPADAVAGDTFARFRLSSTGGLGPTGQASDGEVEDYALPIITVSPGNSLLPDPQNPGQQMLSIVGGGGSDRIVVEQLRTHRLQVRATTNGRNSPVFNMTDFRRIIIVGGPGDDTIEVKLGRPALVLGEGGNDRITTSGGWDEIHGGAGNDIISSAGGNDIVRGGDGNDTLRGGGGQDQLHGEGGRDSLFGEDGADLLLGGFGDDLLFGGSGRDVLIGGSGRDQLSGDQGDDILIGGNTAHDENQAALAALMAGWNSSSGFPARTSSLASSLDSSSVFDSARDRLTGGSERDWLIDFALTDLLVGFTSRSDRKN